MRDHLRELLLLLLITRSHGWVGARTCPRQPQGQHRGTGNNGRTQTATAIALFHGVPDIVEFATRKVAERRFRNSRANATETIENPEPASAMSSRLHEREPTPS
ncbi:hypothetical protein [Nocardia africana]